MMKLTRMIMFIMIDARPRVAW